MTQRLFLWALTSALAGFLFGFDTIVISGAEKKIQELWELSGTMHGLCMSSALWGTVLGAVVGGWPTLNPLGQQSAGCSTWPTARHGAEHAFAQESRAGWPLESCSPVFASSPAGNRFWSKGGINVSCKTTRSGLWH